MRITKTSPEFEKIFNKKIEILKKIQAEIKTKLKNPKTEPENLKKSLKLS